MKLGLVLEGGASRTVFSCGIMDSLLKYNILADYVIGASAGISYGVSYCAEQIGRNRRIIAEYMDDTRYMGIRHFFDKNNKCYYNLEFVYKTIPGGLVPFDFDKYRDFKGNIIAAVTRLDTGEAEHLELPRDDSAFLGLQASCALPLLFKPIKIGNYYYMDGGIVDSIPFEKALADGCDKIIVILTRERGYIKKREAAIGLISACYRRYPKFVAAVKRRHDKYNSDIKKLFKYEREGRAFVICPPDTHGIKRTERKPGILLQFHDEGYIYAESVMDKIKSFLE
ncbi:MAG: patatin family protein [Eubacterium sp.]|nr:patatin family protein [Eubacterium sp.]